ncbi:putative death-receptor fusion protein-domain-containing protein [Nemania abortiva]|nr:putative death-receptor fusion protein-domain-containing protein [Nemania abortiva]
MSLDELPEIGAASFNQKAVVAWLEQQSEEQQSSLAKHVFEKLLVSASQPKQSSGSACSKLCGFVEICSKSASPVLNRFAFAHATSMKMFNYFIEWNEQDAHRSMRLVLDYIVTSIRWNPDADISKSIKDAILDDTISVITLQASKPSTKSSMIAIEHFIQKKVLYLSEVLHVYQRLRNDSCSPKAAWDSFISRVFARMELQNVWTAAGKLLVTILTQPWHQDDKYSKHHPNTWHSFILSGLKTNLELLEPIKVYIFIPLFRIDPISTLVYLNELTSLQRLTTNDSQGWDLNAMIWVALLEAGKKTGVVGESAQASKHNMGVSGHVPTHILDTLLCHASHDARASGLSILVASPSTTKPYALETLRLLQKHLPSFYEDVDPKIRYDVLGHSRNMIRRLHNSVDTLRKEADRVSRKLKTKALASKDTDLVLASEEKGQDEGRPTTKENLVESPTEILHTHEKFIEWYASFLKGELVPTASYQRHITSLRAMSYFLKSNLIQGDATPTNCWPVNVLIDNTWFRSVLDLILDPYDDVRETAASLIMLLQSRGSMSGPPTQINGLSSNPFKELQLFCRKANNLALKTARADHCDGAARSQELLFRWSSSFEEAMEVLNRIFSNLDGKLCAAEKDLAAAVLQAPVHGDFASVGYIWRSLTNIQLDQRYLITLDGFQDRAILYCRRVWEAVQHILCDDSPEGHLPEELQQIEGLDTKDLLSYSFRAIHESSNLMRSIAQNARYDRKQGFLAPTRQNFEDIGNLTFDELSNLRHRGAFSTVSQTFTACCQLVQCIPTHQNDIDLLQRWYEGALLCIHTQGSTTRRSAGIPAIIVGILASKAGKPSFRDVIIKLQEIGRQPAFVSETDGSNLPQVHALNCLKDIFKTSFLSSRAEPYLTDCLQLAALSLQSEVWAIRNCGLLLLRSLIDNLFGTNESKSAMESGWDGRTVRIAYHRFEALPSLLVNLLELGKKSSGITIGTQTAEAVFPALDIIRRAGPPEGHIEKLYDIVSWYLGSRIWHVREIAARTLCSLLLTPTWLRSIKLLVSSPDQNSNKLHGALLTIRFLLERLLQVMPEQLSEENIYAIYELLSDLATSSSYLQVCTEVQAVYMDILNFMAKTTKTQPKWFLQDDGIIKAQQGVGEKPLALLNIRAGERSVHQAFQETDEEAIDMLDQELKTALATDVNVACGILEAISSSSLPQTRVARSRLATTYAHVCLATKAPEPRTAALEGLASLIDVVLSSASEDIALSIVPSEKTMLTLWSDLHQKPTNSSLSDAIIRISGPLVAVTLARARGKVDEHLSQRLSSWGAMMSDAGIADRTFDTRIAAIEAISSLSTIVRFPAKSSDASISKIHPAHLPWLLALYDALTDDDVDVREAAAGAASSILGLALVPVEAGSRLLCWLAERFGHEPDFLTHLGGRMVGHNFGSTCFITASTTGGSLPNANGLEWISAEIQLAEAMRFDDSLFVVEEHNQYIDEVREAKRWADVFLSADLSAARPAQDNVTKALAEWTLAGLRTLARIAQSESAADGDGPLGWTSKPQVFAICARVLICASTLAKLKNTCSQAGDEGGEGENINGTRVYKDVSEELGRFWNLGHDDRTGVHGLLLGMCGIKG